MSKPVLAYDFEQGSDEGNFSAKILWHNPSGKVVKMSKPNLLNNSAIKEFVELKVSVASQY